MRNSSSRLQRLAFTVCAVALGLILWVLWPVEGGEATDRSEAGVVAPRLSTSDKKASELPATRKQRDGAGPSGNPVSPGAVADIVRSDSADDDAEIWIDAEAPEEMMGSSYTVTELGEARDPEYEGDLLLGEADIVELGDPADPTEADTLQQAVEGPVHIGSFADPITDEAVLPAAAVMRRAVHLGEEAAP